MSSEIEKHLETIKNSSNVLNALADRATQQIKSLDKFLCENNPGVEVCRYGFHSEQGKNLTGHLVNTRFAVAFCRDESGKWGLCIICDAIRTDKEGNPIEFVNDYDGTSESTYETLWIRRLSDAPREIRLAALPELSGLLESLAIAAQKLSRRVERSLDTVEAVTSELMTALNKE